MGKSRAAKATPQLAVARLDGRLTKRESNLFECLEIEEPFNFAFLKSFPREIRDRIYEYAIPDVIWRKDSATKSQLFVKSYSHSRLNVFWVRSSKLENLLLINQQVRS